MLFAAICIVALYKTWPMLFPKAAHTASVDPACDLRANGCTTQLNGGGSVTFSIQPRDIPVVKPLALRVDLAGIEAKSIAVDFSGVDMNMGFNRTQLSAQGDGVFSGKGMLPVCVWDAMEWEARVLIDTSQGLISVPYRFITVRPGVPLPDVDS
ncbi:MAG: hypothetical protein B6D78_06785 [gamma proteobacterium symbiont of Ctena orbiculata]|nr:MAG: hypothetical protein B6D78_06785 [gamma proteobacterium symbiont of Ctena orbiculata]